jgi:hypothetical protein
VTHQDGIFCANFGIKWGGEDDYRGARPRDHLICSFDCDACTFFRLKGRLPIWATSAAIGRFVSFVERIFMPSGLARKGPSDSSLEASKSRSLLGKGMALQLPPPHGSFPAHHDFGMRMAIGVLEKSLKAGRHEATTKF